MLAEFVVTETNNLPTILPLSALREIFETQKWNLTEDKESILSLLNQLDLFLESGLRGEKIVKTIFQEKRFELNLDSVSNYEVLFYTHVMMDSKRTKRGTFQSFIEEIQKLNKSVIKKIKQEKLFYIPNDQIDYMKEFVEYLEFAYTRIIK